MSLLYIVFKNRTSTLMFFNYLNKYKIVSKVVDTPKKIMSSCGLSVEVDIRYLKKILNVMKMYKINDFYGIYKHNRGEGYFEKIV